VVIPGHRRWSVNSEWVCTRPRDVGGWPASASKRVSWFWRFGRRLKAGGKEEEGVEENLKTGNNSGEKQSKTEV